jgi:hypothetical protein
MNPIPSEWLHPGAMVPVTEETVRELLESVRVAYRAGQEAEREACAKVADLVAREIDDTNGTATYIAAAIRARGQQ